MWNDGKQSSMTRPGVTQGATIKLNTGTSGTGGALADALTESKLAGAPAFDPTVHGASAGTPAAGQGFSPEGFNILQRYATPQGGGRFGRSRRKMNEYHNNNFLREQMAGPSYNPDLPNIYAEVERPNPFGLGFNRNKGWGQ